MRTPVVAFDIPCLRALVDDTVGARVAAFDVGDFADALRSLSLDAARARHLGSAGPGRIRGLRWDDLAVEQGRIYRQAVDE